MSISKWGTMAAVLLAMTAVAWADWPETLKQYNCIEVEKFTVDRDTKGGKKDERASAIPDDTLGRLQQKIVTELQKSRVAGQITAAGQSQCKDKTLVFGGKMVDFKKGDKTKRYFIGLGAGAQKFEVDSLAAATKRASATLPRKSPNL